jgi:hypothetical protein
MSKDKTPLFLTERNKFAAPRKMEDEGYSPAEHANISIDMFKVVKEVAHFLLFGIYSADIEKNTLYDHKFYHPYLIDTLNNLDYSGENMDLHHGEILIFLEVEYKKRLVELYGELSIEEERWVSAFVLLVHGRVMSDLYDAIKQIHTFIDLDAVGFEILATNLGGYAQTLGLDLKGDVGDDINFHPETDKWFDTISEEVKRAFVDKRRQEQMLRKMFGKDED